MANPRATAAAAALKAKRAQPDEDTNGTNGDEPQSRRPGILDQVPPRPTIVPEPEELSTLEDPDAEPSPLKQAEDEDDADDYDGDIEDLAGPREVATPDAVDAPAPALVDAVSPGRVEPVIDRAGFPGMPASPPPPAAPPAAPELAAAAAEPPGSVMADVDVDAVLATVDELADTVWADVPDERMRDLLRQGVQAFRQAVALGRARQLLPPNKTLTLMVAVRADLTGPSVVKAGDYTG